MVFLLLDAIFFVRFSRHDLCPPCDSLHDTLPGFHITSGYFPKLDEALKTKNGQARLNATRVAHNVLVFLEKRRTGVRLYHPLLLREKVRECDC